MLSKLTFVYTPTIIKSTNVFPQTDFSFFVERRPDAQKVRVSPQLTLAAFQFMSTSKREKNTLDIKF